MKLSFALLSIFLPCVVSQDLDIPTTATNNDSLTTLVAALGAAQLVDALSEPNGPFTVFAPTDDAFASLPEGLVACLLLPENNEILSNILTYHVVEGALLSTDLEDGASPETLNSETISISLANGVTINDSANVTTADVGASNGVIHIIDSVLVPPSVDVTAFLATCSEDTDPPTDDAGTTPAPTGAVTPPPLDIPATAIDNGGFTNLVVALETADLVNALSTPNGPYTVFAPSDDAFAGLPSELVTCLLEGGNIDALLSILRYHVLEGQFLSTQLQDGSTLETLNAETISIAVTDGVTINDAATVVAADIQASNGVIHVIDSVLVPASLDVAAFLASCATGTASNTTDNTDDSPVDIPTTASNAGIFETLVAALTAADLVSALEEPNGPFTVFAPGDEAFEGLPSGLVTCLLEPENKEVLTTVLTYHVVEGTVTSADLVDGMITETLSGENITIGLGDDVTINEDTTVTTADVIASNGVIHIIDSVLVPPSINIATFLEGCDVEEGANGGDGSDGGDGSNGDGFLENSGAPVFTLGMLSTMLLPAFAF